MPTPVLSVVACVMKDERKIVTDDAMHESKDLGQQRPSMLLLTTGDQNAAFADSLEHRVAMAIVGLAKPIEELQRISETAEGRDLLIAELGDLSSAALALKLIVRSVEARDVANAAIAAE